MIINTELVDEELDDLVAVKQFTGAQEIMLRGLTNSVVKYLNAHERCVRSSENDPVVATMAHLGSFMLETMEAAESLSGVAVQLVQVEWLAKGKEREDDEELRTEALNRAFSITPWVVILIGVLAAKSDK